MTKTKSLGSEVYGDVASFGRIWAIMGAVFATLIAIVMIVSGVYIVNHRSHLKKTQAVALDNSSCTTTGSNQDKTTSCKTRVSYKAGSTPETATVISTTSYTKGETLDVWYDPNHPDHAEADPVPSVIGWFLIVGAILMGVGSWVWVWITGRYKFAAAATGTAEAANLIFRR